MRIPLIVIVTLCLAAIGVAFATRGGGDRSRDADGRIAIDYWETWTGFEADAMRAVVDEFNASQDRVRVRMLTTSTIDQKLMLAVSAGRPPDVAGLNTYAVSVYAEKNALLPLDALAAEAGIRGEQYIPVVWRLCNHRGMLWALPTVPAAVAMHYNVGHFRAAGLDPARSPASIAELDAIAERLTIVEVRRGGRSERVRFTELTADERDAHAFSLVQLGFAPSIPGYWNPMWSAWFGGVLWDGESRITTDSPANVAAFEWYQSYVKKYGVENLRTFASSFGNFASPQDPFFSGRVSIVLQGVWMANFIEKYAPTMEWAAAPMPSADPARLGEVTLVESNVLVIPRGSRHPREAFEFIRFVQTRPELEKLALAQRKTPPTRDVSDAFFARHPNPYARLFDRLLRSPNAASVPRVPVWNEYSDEMIALADRLGAMSVTPAAGLAAVRERMQWKLDRVLRRWALVGEARVRAWHADDARLAQGQTP